MAFPKESYIQVGKLGKPFGVGGEIRCKVEDSFRADFLSAEVIFIEVWGRKTPFFVGTIFEGDGLSLTMEEVDTKEAAHKLSGKPIWMRAKDLRDPHAGGQPALPAEQLLGYTIHDKTYGELGKVTDFIELPQQILLVVPYKEKEVFVPFQEALILEFNSETRSLIMDLPEGLLDL